MEWKIDINNLKKTMIIINQNVYTITNTLERVKYISSKNIYTSLKLVR